MPKTIIVSNRLPVSGIKKDNQISFSPSAGGLATGLGSIYKKGDNIWIGWPGIYTNEPSEKEHINQELQKENMSPVFLSQEDIEKFYEGFSNSTLWPLFHYFPKYVVNDHEYWETYQAVNSIFCEQILKHANQDDIIWVHDYQLLLLPTMLRKYLPDATIGFFQHIPFPSYEIFRMLPWRSEILEGMIGADLIGFHTYDDVRHFLSSVSRIVGVDNKMGQLRIADRVCNVDSFPMGIDYEKFSQAVQSAETKKEIENLRNGIGEQRLIISIDRLDYSKGIPERLKAFDKFLETYPDFRGNVSLIFVLVPSRDKVALYKELKVEIDELVGRINGKYGSINWSPIHYFYRSFPFTSLSAFYGISDVALVTPLRDGMNLVAKEYIASKTDKKGVLILSEMAGAAKELSDAIIINPNDINAIVDALHEALTMPEQEQVLRNTNLQNILKRYDIHSWVNVFMNRLHFIKEKENEMKVRQLNIRLQKKLLEDFKKAETRILFLDYDGTLMPFSTNPGKVKPDDELLEILEKLSSNLQNKVVLISGRNKDSLEEWLGHLNIDMIAEHGVWLKESRPFWSLIDYLTDEWKSEIYPILETYVDRTPGSFIETKDYSLVWHYRKAERDLGEQRARELVSHLQYLTTNMQLQVLEGNKVIEVKNSGINKGKAALRWLQNPYDFIFAAGDDWTDEDMFDVLPDFAYTLKVGFSPTIARYNIESWREMRLLLSAMASELVTIEK
ncbi:MAG: bifunctional alpha,alpha-trehalose-phosphate synthase (UDP-forming)/trehalose-phosphatase [Cytophagaceae bacterium]|nr:bifunctional alpha,alpha-trehalose-phosphate synthase (UDP-forming)/trehalose-phosphatase [Cytophagaceae bacterium]